MFKDINDIKANECTKKCSLNVLVTKEKKPWYQCQESLVP
jgi:hypothetical protein